MTWPEALFGSVPVIGFFIFMVFLVRTTPGAPRRRIDTPPKPSTPMWESREYHRPQGNHGTRPQRDPTSFGENAPLKKTVSPPVGGSGQAKGRTEPNPPIDYRLMD